MGVSTAKRAQVALRRAEAIRLRLGGAMWDEIASQLGYASKGAACKDVGKALEQALGEVDRSASEMRRLLLARLEKITWAMWPDAMNGDAAAARTILRAIAQQVKLYALDDPKRLDQAVSNDLDGEIEKFLGMLLEEERRRFDAATAALEAERRRLTGTS